MIIENLINNKKPFVWFLFHFFLGIISVFSKYVFIIYFYSILFSSTQIIINNSNYNFKYISIIVYLTSFEVFGRILNCSPWIPYEISKYLLFLLLSWGILKIKFRLDFGFFSLLLLIPSLFYDLSGKVIFEDFVFNILGPINLSLAIIFFSRQKINFSELVTLLRFLLLPLLSCLFYSFLVTESIYETNFELVANRNFTGGFGSNQVSTVFGLAFFILFVFILNKWNFSGYYILDIILITGFLLMGLLSFSRGGIIGGFISSIVYFYYFYRYNSRKKSFTNIIFYSFAFSLFFYFLFLYTNNLTDGNLLLRYEGKTNGTITEGIDVSLDKYTSGRFNLFLGELELFYKNLFGVGAGASKYLRTIRTGTVTHTELGRLLSESGILGFLYFLILTAIILIKFKNTKLNLNRSILLSLMILGFFTTFHAATRTYITPLLFGIGCISYNYSKHSSFKVL